MKKRHNPVYGGKGKKKQGLGFRDRHPENKQTNKNNNNKKEKATKLYCFACKAILLGNYPTHGHI